MFSKVGNKLQWSSLLDKALFKTFFHSPDWENFLEKEFSWIKFEHYVWRDEMLLSIANCRLLGKEKLVSHPFCEYGGPLLLKDRVDLEGFITDSRKFFGERARIKFHPSIKSGSAGNLATFWIENYSKKTVDNLWRGFRKTVRQEIKGGEGRGIYVEDCRSQVELGQFYDIYLDTVRRHKNIPLPFAVFKFLHEGAVDADILLAKKDGKVLGGSAFLFYPPFVHYFINASDYKLRELNIGYAILWYAMQKYAGKDYDYFDLGGTREGSSLEIFKRGWGAKEYPIYEIGGSAKGLTGSPYRSILGLIPTALMKRFATIALWAKI